MILPRICGKTGEISRVDPADKDKYRVGEWLFHVELSYLNKPDIPPQSLYSKTSYPTREKALAEMKVVIKELHGIIQEAFDGKRDGRYIDLKTNELRKWGDEH